MKSLLIIIVLAATVAAGQPHGRTQVNFSHLNHLTENIRLDGEDVSIVHIYADYPAYAWTDAGEEGIACVDDGARAAVAYLRDFELRNDNAQLSRARGLLKFLIAMQAEDGEFYNFIRKDHSINRDGKTSLKSFGWWAGRAIWAMSFGYRILKDKDIPFAGKLHRAILRSLPHVGHLLENVGKTESTNGFRTPRWLLYESGADATTELMLGLVEYYRATKDTVVSRYIHQLADGLMVMQDGDERTFPYGAHRSWQTIWHSWGNSQSCVLAYAGVLLSDTSMIASAEREARGFYSRLLIEGLAKEWDCALPARKLAYEQIAYDIRPMVYGLLRLYDATHNEVYQKMAGLAASWLLGNNVLHATMYDASTGRCYDGITDSTNLNRNSGAESTIEALLTFLELEQYPVALKYSAYRKIAARSTDESITGTFRNGPGDTVLLGLDLKTGTLYSRDVAGKNK